MDKVHHCPHTGCGRTPARLALLIAAALLAVLGVQSVAQAQAPGTRERQIRAALIYKLARFVTWPDGALPAGGPFTFCYVSDQSTSQALAGIEGRAIQNHPTRMRWLDAAEARVIGGCNLLYLSGKAGLPADARAAALATAMLVVVDGPRTGAEAGMVQLVPRENRVTLVVDLAMVRDARLRIDATLLQMAEVRQ